MHYSTFENDHKLPYDPFKAIVTPRPIGWIGSKNKNGLNNLAPYSYFNAISHNPQKFIMFSSTNYKDSVQNIEDTGEFTCSLATYELFNNMNYSSAEVKNEIDEFKLANLTPEKGKYVNANYVKESPAALECKLWKVIDLPNSERDLNKGNFVVFGEVIGIYINDNFIKDGLFDTAKAMPMARLGYKEYGVINKDNILTKSRPEVDEKREKIIKS
tara:strand:- start:988 stop:1632 length:645 start_codon:yes stop_codon:yes gene_type:complete